MRARLLSHPLLYEILYGKGTFVPELSHLYRTLLSLNRYQNGLAKSIISSVFIIVYHHWSLNNTIILFLRQYLFIQYLFTCYRLFLIQLFFHITSRGIFHGIHMEKWVSQFKRFEILFGDTLGVFELSILILLFTKMSYKHLISRLIYLFLFILIDSKKNNCQFN